MSKRTDRNGRSIGSALSGALLPDGGYIPSRTRSIHMNLEMLVAYTGSGRAAARTLGVAESTLRGWRHGTLPKGDRNAEIVSAARRAGAALDTKFIDAYTGQTELTIRALVAVSSDNRDRTLNPGRVIPLSTVRRALNLWLAGEDEKAGTMLARSMDTYYTAVEIDPYAPVEVTFR